MNLLAPRLVAIEREQRHSSRRRSQRGPRDTSAINCRQQQSCHDGQQRPQHQTVLARVGVAAALAGVLLFAPGDARAGLLSPFGDEKDPVRPFTLYGYTTKKLVIEVLDGEKIVSRKKGVMVKSCVQAIVTGDGGTSVAEQVGNNGEAARQACASAELPGRVETSDDLLPVCTPPCKTACEEAMVKRAALERRSTGYRMEPEDERKVTQSCTRTCVAECKKPGTRFDFSLPYRR